MLVLTRKVGEEIIIDENITVKVLEVSKSRIKLGFIAPGAFVHRGEVYAKIEEYSPVGSCVEPALA